MIVLQINLSLCVLRGWFDYQARPHFRVARIGFGLLVGLNAEVIIFATTIEALTE
jgi:hypothetical protein